MCQKYLVRTAQFEGHYFNAIVFSQGPDLVHYFSLADIYCVFDVVNLLLSDFLCLLPRIEYLIFFYDSLKS